MKILNINPAIEYFVDGHKVLIIDYRDAYGLFIFTIQMTNGHTQQISYNKDCTDEFTKTVDEYLHQYLT